MSPEFTASLLEAAARRWPGALQTMTDAAGGPLALECRPDVLAELCAWLFRERDLAFAGLIVEERPTEWLLRYVFHGIQPDGWTHVLVRGPLDAQRFPSISARVHAADWHEREVEDGFGLVFEGHPALGDFVLHNDRWQERLEPMRKRFDGSRPVTRREPDRNWQPPRLLHQAGAFGMPVGPVFSGSAESMHFLLETIGEDVTHVYPRLFYKYRAIEKVAEGRSVEDVVLLAERCNGLSAFAHALACCQAAEGALAMDVPPRARALRAFLAELERVRHHVGAIHEICESTALAVATSQAAILEEELLRVSGVLAGHRYLFGLSVPGGLARDMEDAACRHAWAQARDIHNRLQRLARDLRFSNSFLDRLEEVGVVPPEQARSHGLVGPVARASGLSRDLRKAQPYAGYEALRFEVPCEQEGDGYARLRILVAETAQSLELMDQLSAALPPGPVRVPLPTGVGAALGWAEAPIGATFHWLRIGEHGRVERYRLVTPSFINWPAFHLAAENFAFQDFPIILASFGLSVTESDR
jgi:formate hydrogenlyase subunit 5